MKILVIGGSSGVGRKVVDEALSRGHVVRAMARHVDALPADIEGLEPFAGDALDASAIEHALTGVDVVVQALGVGRVILKPWDKVTLFSRSTEVLIGAMKRTGRRRLVSVTGFGAGDSRLALSGPERIGHRALLGKAYADKDRQEMLITASGLDWTIVRPTILTNGGRSGHYRVLTAGNWRNGLISRSDVADYILDAVERGLHIGEAVVLAR